jgi:hypothetical protein
VQYVWRLTGKSLAVGLFQKETIGLSRGGQHPSQLVDVEHTKDGMIPAQTAEDATRSRAPGRRGSSTTGGPFGAVDSHFFDSFAVAALLGAVATGVTHNGAS